MAGNPYEIVESIKFFASLVSTEGVNDEIKKVANDYMEALIKSLKGSIQDQVDSMSPLKLMR
jgi:hypothetical protein